MTQQCQSTEEGWLGRNSWITVTYTFRANTEHFDTENSGQKNESSSGHQQWITSTSTSNRQIISHFGGNWLHWYKKSQTQTHYHSRKKSNGIYSYLGFETVFSAFFFPRAFGGAGINSSEDGNGNGRSADVSTFGKSGLVFPLDFFCFVDTSDNSRGLAVCKFIQFSIENTHLELEKRIHLPAIMWDHVKPENSCNFAPCHTVSTTTLQLQLHSQLPPPKHVKYIGWHDRS